MKPHHSLPILAALIGCNSNDDFTFPPAIGESKYITYYTDVDASTVCLDDLLSREDEFIERTAMLLSIEPSGLSVDYIWNPKRENSDPWICPDGELACYGHREEDLFSVVISNSLSNHHEIVHAVDVQGLGHESHGTLREGLAEYLGSLNSTPSRDNFASAFKAMLAKDPHPDDYLLAMHFVGSIFERHGAQKTLQLRSAMPTDAKLDEFSKVFEEVFLQKLDDALEEMNGTRIFGIDHVPGCTGDDVRKIAWTSEILIDTIIESKCGDPWFYGTGFADGLPGFFGRYQVEITNPGMYEFVVDEVDSNSSPPLYGALAGCSFEMLTSAVLSKGGAPSRQNLQTGLHTLGIAFAQGSEARGAAKVRLEYIGEP